MKQRVGIAAGAGHGARVLLMDEPFGSLDAQSAPDAGAAALGVGAPPPDRALITHDTREGRCSSPTACPA